jgi:uncharacterized protein YndB with AHSA1/START domain
MGKDIRIERTMAASPAQVWRALTDPRALGEWLMENDFVPRVGHKFQFRTKPEAEWNGIVDCEVLELDEPRRLTWAWRGNSLDTRVTWTLAPVAGGTLLTMEHSGFAGPFGEMVAEKLRAGWQTKVLERLERIALTQPGGSSK